MIKLIYDYRTGQLSMKGIKESEGSRLIAAGFNYCRAHDKIPEQFTLNENLSNYEELRVNLLENWSKTYPIYTISKKGVLKICEHPHYLVGALRKIDKEVE